jgi:hypothetical protein
MAGDTVPWHTYSGRDVEELVAALLVRTVPGAQRIDGAGGDDGVDVRAPLDDGYRIYQIKGFYERLTASQKGQIAKSLATAVRLQPETVRWTLVLPLDLSPAEDRWFSGTLAAKASVPIDWIGRTDIEQGLSGNRDLLRAFAPGSTERRAMDLLGEYHAEKAAMTNGMVDGIERLIGLKSQMDLTDPDWAFDVRVAGTDVNIELRPKDAGAALRRPIRVGFEVSPSDETATRQYEQFMRYGRPAIFPSESIVEFRADLPGNLVEVIKQSGTPTLSVMKSDAEKAWRLIQRVDAVRDGRVIGTLPLEWDDRSSGPLGGTWVSGRDRSGFLEVTMTADADLKGGITVRSPASDNVLPEEVVPVLRFLSLLKAGDYLRLTAPGLDPVECRISGDPASDIGGTFEDGIALAEALARIKSAAGVRFPLPASWSAKDGELIYFWDQILSNGQVQWYWPNYAVNLPGSTVVQLLSKSVLPRLSMNGASVQDPVIQLVGQDVPIQGQLRFEVTNLVIPNPRTLAAQVKNHSPLTPVMVPLISDDLTLAMCYLDRET